MSERDLGTITGTVLVFGGPYSNLHATLAMQAEAARIGISADHVICTGDTVAYCADPQATVDALRAWGVHVVMGNCEESLGEFAADCGCGFEAGTACSLLSVTWYRYANTQLNAAARDWMRSLPRCLRFTLGGKRFACVHGSPVSINEFVFASTNAAHKQAMLDASNADVVIGGHCGVPFSSSLERGWWLNAGVIGMPANDGEASTWYMLLEPHHDAVRVTWQRLTYDVAQAQQAMCEAGLPPDYRDALASGLWPSEDVLPVLERQQRGKKLRLEALSIR